MAIWKDQQPSPKPATPEPAPRAEVRPELSVSHEAPRRLELQVKESVIAVRQEDGTIRAFYNSCGHRGMRMVDASSSVGAFHCPYHGWRWGIDGTLEHAQDGESDFRQGNPCG